MNARDPAARLRWSESFAYVGLAAYFGVILLPHRWPALGASPWWLVYWLSIPLVLLVLAGVAVGTATSLRSTRSSGSPSKQFSRRLARVSLVGLLIFGAVIVLANSIRRSLPTGSFVMEFDPDVWRDPASTLWSDGDITPRQKMLGSAVEQLTPGMTRSEIEALLGPPTETSYFEASGRDLVYVTGPERDSFIGVDSEWLLIWLDESGGFERYEIARD